MKNLDRLMSGEYEEDEYPEGDPRHYEQVNLCEGEDIDDLLAVEQRVCLAEYYEEPFEVVLDSGAGEHVASDADAPGYSVVESRGSKMNQNFIGAGATE